MIPAGLLTLLICTGGHRSGFLTEATFDFFVIRYTSSDGADIESLKALFRCLCLEVLDHIIPRSEEQAVVVGRDPGFLVPGHVAHLIDVDGLLSLTGDQRVRPLAVRSGGTYLGLAEDAGISLPLRCGRLSPPEKK